MESTKAISISVDFWSDTRQRWFMGLTAHYIYNYQLKRFLLELKHVTGTHSGPNIEKWFIEVIDQYKLDEKLFRIGTDNAKNLTNGLGFSDRSENLIEYSSDTSSDENINQNEQTVFDLERSIDTFREIMNQNNIKRVSCYNHTLQLVVKDGLALCKSIQAALSKANDISKLTHQNKNICELMSQLKLKSIPLKNTTRWNSKLYQTRTVLEILPDISEHIPNQSQLTSVEIKQLKELVLLLEPFEMATKLCEAENAATINLVAA